jgi:hypothetical protein
MCHANQKRNAVEEQQNSTADKSDSTNDATKGLQATDAKNIEPSIQATAEQSPVKEVKTKDSGIHKENATNNTTPTDISLAERIKQAERWMIILTAIIAGAAVLNLIVFYCESESTYKQITRLITESSRIAGDMESSIQQNQTAIDNAAEANRMAVEASNTQNRKLVEASIKQSKAALDASIAISRNDQRAWVGVVGVVTAGGKASKDNFSVDSVTITIRNSGKSPALKMGGNCCIIETKLWNDLIPDYDASVRQREELEKTMALKRRRGWMLSLSSILNWLPTFPRRRRAEKIWNLPGKRNFSTRVESWLRMFRKILPFFLASTGPQLRSVRFFQERRFPNL